MSMDILEHTRTLLPDACEWCPWVWKSPRTRNDQCHFTKHNVCIPWRSGRRSPCFILPSLQIQIVKLDRTCPLQSIDRLANGLSISVHTLDFHLYSYTRHFFIQNCFLVGVGCWYMGHVNPPNSSPNMSPQLHPNPWCRPSQGCGPRGQNRGQSTLEGVCQESETI